MAITVVSSGFPTGGGTEYLPLSGGTVTGAINFAGSVFNGGMPQIHNRNGRLNIYTGYTTEERGNFIVIYPNQVSFSNMRLAEVEDPLLDNDAANKQYVDNVIKINNEAVLASVRYGSTTIEGLEGKDHMIYIVDKSTAAKLILSRRFTVNVEQGFTFTANTMITVGGIPYQYCENYLYGNSSVKDVIVVLHTNIAGTTYLTGGKYDLSNKIVTFLAEAQQHVTGITIIF